MAEATEPSGESRGAEVKTQPVEKALASPHRRRPRSVLKVSQLLLRAIAAHRGLTLATLRKEFGSAGYQVRRKTCRSSGESRPETKGTLLRVSGSNAAGYFRVWKVPKSKRRPGRPRRQDSGRAPRRASPPPRRPRRRRSRRKAAKKAREVWRRNARMNAKARRARPKAREPRRARAKEEASASVTDRRRGRPSKEDTRPAARDERRPSSKLREEKQEPEKTVKQATQKPRVVKSDCHAGGQGKAHTKMCPKSEDPRSVAGTAQSGSRCSSSRHGCLSL